MMIDLERAEVISKLPPPHNKKSMQSFTGKINFVRTFIPSFAEIVKPLQDMVKQKAEYKWEVAQREAFASIKEAIANSPSLMSPNFLKEFILYTFTIDTLYATVLTQKNQDGNEVPISFMSAGLDEAQLKYPEVDKQDYTIFKVVKHFHPYLLKSQMKVIVPYPAVRNLFVQKELGEIRAHWMTTLREYDLEIKPAKIVRGQGLCQMAAEAVVEEGWENKITMYEIESFQVNDIFESWYADLKHYLSTGCVPEALDARKWRELRLKSARY